MKVLKALRVFLISFSLFLSLSFLFVLFFTSWIATSPKKEDEAPPAAIHSAAETKILNCKAALEKHHIEALNEATKECFLQIAPNLCLPEEDNCLADLIGFCRTTARMSLQLQVLQCAQSGSTEGFLKRTPKNLLLIPEISI